jgi:sigma-B regulation protein RsbU (phosphoserine phosphatase)
MERKQVQVEEEYLRGIERKMQDLSMLIEVSALISSTLDFNELMTIVMEKAKGVMDAEACSILMYNREKDALEFEVAISTDEQTSDLLKQKVTVKVGQGIAGYVARHLQPLVIADARADKRFLGDADKQTGFTTKSLIAVPLVGRGGLIGVAEIMNPRHKVAFSDYDLEIFQTLCRQVAIAIENSLFHKESLEHERHMHELDLASTIQRSFLPESPVFKQGSMVVSAVNVPAKQVGGDLYDFVALGEGQAGVFIGDISGKGISAALYMAKIISDFRYLAHREDSPEAVLNHLNALMTKAPRGLFLTAIYMIADTVSGDLVVSAAGHPPFLWITGEEVKVMNIEAGPPLGIMDIEYTAVSISMKQGDRLLLLTDGAFDAKNREGQRMGFDDLTALVKDHLHEEKLLDLIQEKIDSFSKGMDRADDLTLVEIRFSG